MIRVELLGRVCVLRDGQELPELLTQRLRRALLVYLAVQRDVERERVLAMLWPDVDPERARHLLSQTLYKLRGLLGNDWLDSTGDRLVVRETLITDVDEFVAADREGTVEAALTVYRGTFLGTDNLGVSHAFELWIDTQRARFVRMHRRLVRAYTESCVAAGDITPALDLLTRTVAADPSDDEAQHLLIEVLATAGQPREALDRFGRYAAYLEKDGLRPLDHTLALVERIRAGEFNAVQPVIGSAPVPERAPGPAGASAHGAASPPRRTILRLDRRWALAAAVLVLVLSLSTLVWWRAGQPAQLALAPDPIVRIAVDNFEDLSPNGELDILAARLTEAVIERLSDVGRFSIIATGRYQVLRSMGLAADSAARALTADFLLAGAVDRSDSVLRVSVRVVDPRTTTVLRATPLHVMFASNERTLTDAADQAADFLRRSVGEELAMRTAVNDHVPAAARALLQHAEMLRRQGERLFKAGVEADALQAFAGADSVLAEAERVAPKSIQPGIARARLAERHAIAELARTASADGRARAHNRLRAGIAHANRVLERDDTQIDALELRGTLAYRLATFVSDPAQSEELLVRAATDLKSLVERDSMRSASWRLLSDLHWRRAEFAQSKVAAERAWTTDAFLENAPPVMLRLAMSFFELGWDEEAIRWCADGRARFPGRPEFAYCGLFLHAFSTEPARDAEFIAKLLYDADSLTVPVQRPIMGPRNRVLAATALLQLDMRDRAEQHFTAAVRSNPRDTGRLWFEAAYMVRTGADTTALRMLRDYAAAFPSIYLPTVQSRVFESLRGRAGYPAVMPAVLERR